MEPKESCKFAITITLLPRWYRDTATDQYDLSYLHVCKLVAGLTVKFTLIAELTNSFNVHYHGVVTMPNYGNCRKRFVDAFRRSKLFGFVNIKAVDNEEGWFDYIRKSIEATKEDLGRPPIINDDFNIFDNSFEGECYKQHLHDEQ